MAYKKTLPAGDAITAANLRTLRLQAEYSQKHVASAVGMARTVYILVEQGKRGITDEELDTFAELYDVTPDTIRANMDTVRVRQVSEAEEQLLEAIRAADFEKARGFLVALEEELIR